MTAQARGLSRPEGFGWADVIGPAAIAVAVVPVFMWLQNQGLASLTTVDTGLGSLGLLTGLLASVLLLFQCVMLARIPWVEQAWGHDLLARRHRWIGLASFWLMLAHILLFTAQRLNRAGGWNGAALWELFVHETWLLAATVGTVMIIAVVVTSAREARRRLRYESWHLLHLYAYLGVGLALPHQIADGSDFHGTFAQVYWWTLYAVAAGSILTWRLAVPLGRSVYHGLRVESVRGEGPGVVSVIMRGRRLDRLGTQSGQFFIWRFLDGPGWTRGNPYTISAAPERERLRITVKAVGAGSARAAVLRPGTRVLFEGPYGTMTAARRRYPRVLFLAAGVGITPIRALAEDTPYAPGEAMLLYRFDRPAEAILAMELQRIAARRGLDIRYLPGPRRGDGSWLPAGYDGRISDGDALARLVPDIARRDVFLCGPPGWAAAAQDAVLAAGASPRQLHAEGFAW